ncbi:MAG: hypothetical protein J3Q66DRAFT_38352 [Benniella sp.]|nr:MAG: hypothetical protein J3Q66DRAFT_38352 [Benniella sp.]
MSQRKLAKVDSTYLPDSSLAIPGELVLALSERLYYPGRVVSFNSKTNKYKVDYASGHSISIERKKFFTRYEEGFQTCPLGELAMPVIMDHYENKELESQVREVYPILYAMIAGENDLSNRLEAFQQGGKARRSLAQRVGPGSFSREEYALINKSLQSEFIPDLATIKTSKRLGQKRTPALEDSDIPMKRKGDITREYSDTMRLHFVTDVLLPETVTRLTMRRHNISHAQAEEQIMQCKRDDHTDTWWVDDILAARESFLEGHSL